MAMRKSSEHNVTPVRGSKRSKKQPSQKNSRKQVAQDTEFSATDQDAEAAVSDSSQTMPGKDGDTSKEVANRETMERDESKSDEPSDTSGKSECVVVGIGGSAGSLEALEQFFQNLRADTGMAYVVVTHQHKGHISMLPELLDKCASIPVVQASDGMRLEPNHVYVNPPGGFLEVFNGALHLMDGDQNERPPLPIDYLFRSLARDRKQQGICVVLSGTGSDGTVGLRSIKGESGMAMVQEVNSAAYAGMPSSAIATGLADYILPPEAMPEQLVAYAQGPFVRSRDASALSRTELEGPLQKLLVLIRSRTGHDFSSYKTNTILRRVERRMNVHQIQKPADYVRYLNDNAHEIDILFKELLISVTSFFRDQDAFDALSAPVCELIKSRKENETVRVWSAGCCTGEEAYGIAIVLRECLDQLQRNNDVQVFGTDLDSGAIEKARSGRYSEGISVDIDAKRLEQYFVHDDGSYRIRKEIREMVIFAEHNMIRDPPFTRLDLLCCRNVMIYLDSDLQQRLLSVFHGALKPDGLLILGPSETIGSASELFEPFDKKWKIFRRVNSTAARAMIGPSPTPQGAPTKSSSVELPLDRGPTPLTKPIEQLLIREFVPVGVVVDDRGDIVHIHGSTGKYLEPATGSPRLNVLEMAREGLRLELTAAIRTAKNEGEAIRRAVRVKTNGAFIETDVAVRMIRQPESIRGLLLITFRDTTPNKKRSSPAAGSSGHSKTRSRVRTDLTRIEQLERALQFTKETLQNTIEDVEASNEELDPTNEGLQNTNEELQSTNEELQSANEELETSKEELQSLNEELSTVNAELQAKLEELSRANDDMNNLLNSTEIATIFVDNDLNIKRYTERASQLIKLIPSDVGRHIGDLVSNLDGHTLIDDAREVLQTLVYKEKEVSSNTGKWYLMRIMPYRTAENVIDGLVITFVDINRIKQAESEARAFVMSIVDTLREPLLVLEPDLRVMMANHSFYRKFQTSASQTEGEMIFELGGGEWDVPDLRNLLDRILPENTTLNDYEVSAAFPRIGQRSFLLNARRLEQDTVLPGLILLALEEVIQ